MNDGLVQMKATATYTRNSPKTGAILHGDNREKADIAARYPRVSEGDAAFLEREKLAERYDGKVPTGEGDDGTGLTVDERSGVMTEANADAEDSVDQPTALATRDSTVFEAPIEELAGSGGADRAVLTATSAGTAPASDEAPAGGGGTTETSESKPLSRMTTAELDKEAASLTGDLKTEYEAATTNAERVKVLEKARAADQG